MSSPRSRLFPGKRQLFWALLLALTGVVVEAACRVALLALERGRGVVYDPVPTRRLLDHHRRIVERLLAGQGGFLQHDADLGWLPRPGSRSASGTINPQGLRGEREHALEPAADRVRVATFGDSFTYGGDVADPFTFQEFLGRLDPDLEVLNFGVPGHGLDQAYLRYLREGPGYRPQVVVIGFMTENIFRVVSVFRPFYLSQSGVPLAKPRFRVGDGGLELIPNPLPRLADYRDLLDRPQATLARLGEHDLHFRHGARASRWDVLGAVRLGKLLRQRLLPDGSVVRAGRYNPDGEAFRVTTALFDAFHARVEQDGFQSVILVLPNREDIERFRKDGVRGYQPLLDHLAARGYGFLDGMDAFASRGAGRQVGELALSHYTPLGNSLIAEQLLGYLSGHDLLRVVSGARPPAASAEALESRLASDLGVAQASPALAALSEPERRQVLEEIRSGYLAKIESAREQED